MAKRGNLTNFLKWAALAIPLSISSNFAPENQFKKSEELKLNRNDEISYVSHIPKKEAIQDIKEIAKMNSYEESWIHFPKDSSWYEVGIESKIGKDEDYVSKVNVDSQRFIDAVRQSETEKAVLIHNHPGCEEVVSPNDFSPSIADIRTLESFRSLYEKMRPSGELIGGIVSVHGITSYVKREDIFDGMLPRGLGLNRGFSYEKIRRSLQENSSYRNLEKNLKINYREFDEISYSDKKYFPGGGGKFYEILK